MYAERARDLGGPLYELSDLLESLTVKELRCLTSTERLMYALQPVTLWHHFIKKATEPTSKREARS